MVGSRRQLDSFDTALGLRSILKQQQPYHTGLYNTRFFLLY
jgi:hypothetical protein